MASFDDFLNAVLDGAVDLAKQTIGDFPADARSDASRFLTYTEASLREWTLELANGELTPREFADLADDLVDLAKLVALSRLGIAKTALQRFRDGLIELVINTAIKMFVPV